MAQTVSQELVWTQGWGVVRLVHEKLEFVAFLILRRMPKPQLLRPEPTVKYAG
jgi:hypothetical protein